MQPALPEPTGGTPRSASVTASTLPPDIVFLFLERACRDSPYTSHHTLCTVALVCRAWVYPAQRLLWRFVVIQNTRQFEALHRSISDDNARGTGLAKQTRVLKLSERCFRTYERGAPIALLTLKDVGKLLLSFPEVQDLLVAKVPPISSSFDTSDLEVSAMRRPPHIPPLTVLRILGAQPGLVHIFLNIFPTLRFVLLDEYPTECAEYDVEGTLLRSPRCKLYELRWELFSIPLTPHTLQSSIETLRMLSLHSFPPIPNLSQSFMPHLRSLCVSYYSPVLCDAVRQCSALEEFILWQDIPSQDLLDAFPDTLEHMGFKCTRASEVWNTSHLARITAWLRGGTHLRLHTLTCFCPPAGAGVWLDFVKACRVISLELICFAIPYRGYTQATEVLGEVTRFPRAAPPLAKRIQV